MPHQEVLEHHLKVLGGPVVKLDRSELERPCHYRKANKAREDKGCANMSACSAGTHMQTLLSTLLHCLSPYHKFGGQS